MVEGGKKRRSDSDFAADRAVLSLGLSGLGASGSNGLIDDFGVTDGLQDLVVRFTTRGTLPAGIVTGFSAGCCFGFNIDPIVLDGNCIGYGVSQNV